jgi:uncharacterized alpha-E superfamily protein
MERAENVARFVGVNLNLQLDLPMDRGDQWQSLIDTSGDTEVFKERYGVATQDSVVQFLAFDERNPNSIHSCLRAARENARSVRDTISSEMWEQVNRMHLSIRGQQGVPEEGLLDFFHDIRMGGHLFDGLTNATMSHNEAWHFAKLGQMLERADKTSRILDVKYFILLPSARDVGTPYDDIHWSAVLKSVSGFEMYRKKYGRISPRDVVGFLVMDREFPRSIHFSIRSADISLHAITGTPPGSFVYTSEQRMGMMRAELDFASVDEIIREGLHEYLDSLQLKMNAIGDSLKNDFVAREAQTQSQYAR